jgi:hypothetical protein
MLHPEAGSEDVVFIRVPHPIGELRPPDGGRPTVRLSPPENESRVDLPPAT